MEKTKRPMLLTGLILVIVGMGYFAITAFLALFYIGLILDIAQSAGGTVDISATMVTVILLVLGALGVLTVVLASVGISRLKLSPQEFVEKKGTITASLVITIIIAVLSIIGLTSEFSIISLISCLVLVMGAIFTIVGLRQNKKLLNNVKVPEQAE